MNDSQKREVRRRMWAEFYGPGLFIAACVVIVLYMLGKVQVPIN